MMLVFPRDCRNFIAAIFLLLLPIFSVAADSQQLPPPPTPFFSVLQMLFGLGIVLLMIAGGAWILKRFSDAQFGLTKDIRVVSAVAVGPKERVVLVDVGETRLVLGVAPGHVNKLTEMPRPDEVDNAVSTVPTPFVIKLKEKLAARGEIK